MTLNVMIIEVQLLASGHFRILIKLSKTKQLNTGMIPTAESAIYESNGAWSQFGQLCVF